MAEDKPMSAADTSLLTGERSASDVGFTPGSIIASRYRIVSLLGKGGMGEVYRADDLKLGQRVALKYVPLRKVDDSVLQRVFAEVRIGRQISHPNVCRLYDIVEVDGQHFIAMEYVDGEDLASLLRRIGRLPADKALALTRDICGGLAAAHDRGVIHRDLKPANIMIDGAGTARITDFGLAVLGSEFVERDRITGTPAYMAPEQLNRETLTPKTDLYALGLVIFEMFTGRRLFTGTTFSEIVEQHGQPKSRLSNYSREVEPAFERLVLRCLEENPALRPSSARELLLSLPGGDPLQTALDAGQTPSPAMVAAAGAFGDLSAARGWMLMAALIAALIGTALLRDRSFIEAYVPKKKSPHVLADHARDIVHGMTGSGEPAATRGQWMLNREYLKEVSLDRSPRRWNFLASTPPAAFRFNYRESPLPMSPFDASGRITASDPPEIIPGMATLRLDEEGRLAFFRRVPPVEIEPLKPAAPFDWTIAFRHAGLDRQRFVPADPARTPPFGCDRRVAWRGSYTERPDIPIRVEAASLAGIPVYFEVIEPWHLPSAGPAPRPPWVSALAALIFVGLVAAVIFARRNVMRGRVDRRGARRLSLTVGVLSFIGSAGIADHTLSLFNEWRMLLDLIAGSLLDAAQIWVIYLAVEPYLRRRLPRMLIGWNRLLSGRWSDPMVGRDVLIGAVMGTAAINVAHVAQIIPTALALPGHIPLTALIWPENNVTAGLLGLADQQSWAIFEAFGILLLLLLIRSVIRNPKVALVVLTFLIGLVTIGRNPIINYSFGLLLCSVFVLVLQRYGCLALTTALFFYYALLRTPLTMQFDQWYAGRSVSALLLLGAIGAWAFRTSLAGRPLFGAVLADEEAPA